MLLKSLITSRRSARRLRSSRDVQALEKRVLLTTIVETESNNAFGSANVVSVPTIDILDAESEDWLSIEGSISATSDVDFFRFTLSQASGVFFDVDANETGLSSLDSRLDVYDVNQVLLSGGSNDDGFDFEGFAAPENSVGSPFGAGFLDPALYLDLAAGDYFVRVDNVTNVTGAYELKLLADDNYAAMVPEFSSDSATSDTLYLDFDGHTATDDWGTYTAVPFSFDTATTFSPGERLAIRNTWAVSAEDFSAFNLNVSTVEPASFANGVGYREVVTSSDADILPGVSPGILGVAFLGSYAGPGTNTGFTFADNFSSFNSGLNGRVMASSIEMGNTSTHEFGHALDLHHYRTQSGGTGSVLPNGIMSTPDTGLNREIWQAGTNADGNAQDDVAIIGNTANTIGARADDHGDSTATATPLSYNATGYTIDGVIETTADEDFFQFEAVGPTNIDATLDLFSSNGDVELRLYDGAGNLLLTDDPTTSFEASLTTTLSAGTYFVGVRSDGETGEIGQYELSLATGLPPIDVIVNGTSGPDFITVEETAITVEVSVNGQVTIYPIASVLSVDVLAGAGNDEVRHLGAFTVPVTLRGENGDDTLRGNNGDDTMYGGNGADFMLGGPGEDFLRGEDGNDTIIGSDQSDNIAGGRGNDSLTGSGGQDTMSGNDGNDTIKGGTDDDSLVGGDQDDTILGGPGDDTLLGNSGDDRLSAGAGNDTLSGSSGDDSLFGTSGDDTLTGGSGSDSLVGGNGVDGLYGGSGNDTLNGNSGDDSLFGGNDDDSLIGGNNDDYLSAGTGDDSLDGSSGNDTLLAGDGNDTMRGADGNDIMVGGNGNDSAIGSNGADLLIGGHGRDTMKGNAGDDLIIASATSIDGNRALLTAIMAEWSSSNTYLQRVNNLRDGSGTAGGGANGSTYLPDVVQADTDPDALRGQAGLDYFWGLATEVLDLDATEERDQV